MHKQTSILGLQDHDLEIQALSLQKSAKYKEAIKLYKKLLQTDDNEQWRKQIANCYVQRAKGFADKGMVKEALALWENHTAYVQPPYAAYDQYIIWLIQASNQPCIQAVLSQSTAQQLDKQYPVLAAILGFLLLTKHPEFEQMLPQESVFIAHFKVVQAAMQAYQDGNNDKLHAALKQLPYRSAFRDLRTLLSAIVAMSDSPVPAQTLLSKIPAVSPYAPAAQLLLACTIAGAELAEALLQFNHQQRSFVGDIKGLDKKQLDFIQHYSRQHEHLSDKVQFNLVIQYLDLLGTDTAQHFCQTLLASYPAGKKDYYKHFGEPDEFEEYRVKALRCEQDNNLYDADYYWRQCISILDANAVENGLQIALILQRMAAREPEGDKRTELLIDSVAYEPDNRNTYLQIMHYFSQQQETAKEHKLWLSKTLEQFPQDVAVLTQAVKVATRNKTFKKASQYAAKILSIDPLNTFAKQTLFSSYLAHARRLMREKNYRLVAKEISKAEQLNSGKAYHKQVQLMHALLCFASEDKQQGLQKISTALADLHADPVNRNFQASMEALLNGLPVATILRELPAAKEHLLSTQELPELTQQLKLYASDSGNLDYLHKALDKIKAPLKKSLSEQDYPEALLLNLCQVLDSLEHFELLRHCARVGQLQWKNPVWMYYRVYADKNGMAEDCSYWEIQRLENANDQAREAKDYPTSILIDKFLDNYYAAYPERNMGFLEGLFGGAAGGEDEQGDPLEELFGHLPDRVMIDLNSKAEALLKKTTPENLIQGLAQQVDGDQSLLMAMIANPDVFSALMLLRAADELLIDIDTNIDDVIEIFGITENKSAFPFPF